MRAQCDHCQLLERTVAGQGGAQPGASVAGAARARGGTGGACAVVRALCARWCQVCAVRAGKARYLRASVQMKGRQEGSVSPAKPAAPSARRERQRHGNGGARHCRERQWRKDYGREKMVLTRTDNVLLQLEAPAEAYWPAVHADGCHIPQQDQRPHQHAGIMHVQGWSTHAYQCTSG